MNLEKVLKEIDVSKPTTIINGERYYLKKADKYTDGIELVVEILASLVDIKHVYYYRVLIDNKVYYLCKDLNRFSEFIPAEVMCGYKDNLDDIFDILNENYPDEVISLIDEIVKIFMFDILTLNSDRHMRNWGFVKNDQSKHDVYIFDNESCFYKLRPVRLKFKEDNENTFNKSIEVLDRNIEMLDYLLQNSDEYYQEMFKKMYNILTPELVENVFNFVIFNYKVNIASKETLMNNYIENYQKIEELLKGRTLK